MAGLRGYVQFNKYTHTHTHTVLLQYEFSSYRMAKQILVLYRVVSGDGLVGGNPSMNTPPGFLGEGG